MARMKKPFELTGTIGNLSIYKIRGSDEPIARRKGGPTKRMIKTWDVFEATRRNNSEFGGRARMAKQVMYTLRLMKYLGDYNLAGPLNSLFTPIQALDTVSDHGERSIELTKNPKLLEGFNLNRRTPFTTIITNSPEYKLSKDTLKAAVTIPELIQGVNFFPADNFSWYKIITVLGVIDDLFYAPKGYVNSTGYPNVYVHWESAETAWMNITPKNQAVTLTCSLANYRDTIEQVGRDKYSCLLAVGIAYGSMSRGEIEMVKYVGGGKILAMK